jgi:hypothetical protein
MKDNEKVKSQIEVLENALRFSDKVSTTASYYYQLWGSILFVHFFLNLLISIDATNHVLLLKNISILIFPIGGLLSYKKKKYDTKNEVVQSIYERVYFWGFVSFSICYGILFVYTIWSQTNLFYKLYPLFVGTTVAFIGGVIKHKPSILLGFIGCLGAIISLIKNDQQILLLISSLVSLISIYLPGKLLKHGNF